jgi:hypothetical protein
MQLLQGFSSRSNTLIESNPAGGGKGVELVCPKAESSWLLVLLYVLLGVIHRRIMMMSDHDVCWSLEGASGMRPIGSILVSA